MVLTDLANREALKLMTLEYTLEEDGHFLTEPIVQLFCRDSGGNRRTIEVEGFYPSFYITETAYREREDDLLEESMIRHIEVRGDIVSREQRHNAALEQRDEPPRKTLENTNLVRVYTVKPGQVSDLREEFDRTWEADVFFTNRFLIDSGIKVGLSVPEGGERVHYDDIEPLEEAPDVAPRMLTVDIEVWAGNKFPDTTDPQKPVTAITAHDTYDDEYFCGILHPDAVEQGGENSWDYLPFQWELPDGVEMEDVGGIDVYLNEARLLADFNQFVVDKDPDLMTGWNSSRNEMGSGFDYPYIINRCREINEWTVEEVSPTGTTFVTQRGSPVVGGREMFDMLQAYKKTQIHEKRSYSLGYIAEDELGYGKEDVADLDEGWMHEPVEFMQYNVRDTDAVVQIEDAKNVLEMYDHIRGITGATYSEIADSNIGIIDVLFLRQAKEKGFALPTSTRPDVQHYWGAYVFPPEAGKHRNVVYPDLSSLYPNLFRDMNASPETIVGDEEDLASSKWSEEDCHTIYVDTRGMVEPDDAGDDWEPDGSIKKDADDPVREELFVLRPEVKESFVREVIGDLIDMKYEYKKDEYSSEAYGAVKRITNSVYGVMGDSVSYGKGFRLFDWRIAESITLAGRDVIKHTADEFEDKMRSMGYDEAEIVSGDTDSCVCSAEQADGSYEHSPLTKGEARRFIKQHDDLSLAEAGTETALHETLIAAMKAAEYVDGTYAEFMRERFGIEDGNMAVEIESYADSAILMNKKKRYAQWIRWDEGDYVDKVEEKGFELVRSDSAEVTAEVQRKFLKLLLKEDDAKSAVRPYLRKEWKDAVNGNVDLEEIGRPSAINSNIWTYGYSEQDDGSYNYYTPQPHIRGARYARAFIDGETKDSGKPLMFYCDGVSLSADLPETYCYDNELRADADDPRMVEEDREVDAVAVGDVRNLPDEVIVDWEKMAEKTLRDPIEPIVDVMQWDFDDLTTDGRQSGLGAFM